MDNAWYWIRENGGICTEASYPYTSGTTQQAGSCVTSCTKVPEAAPAYWVDVEPGSKPIPSSIDIHFFLFFIDSNCIKLNLRCVCP